MTVEESPKRNRSWNPFQKLEGNAEILSAAKAGAFVSGYLGLSYVLQIIVLYSSGKDTFGNEGMTTMVSDILGVALAAFLAWRIYRYQPFWAAIFVALWFALELAMKIAAIVSGEQTTNFGWIVMFAAITSAAILGVRGSWKLRQARRIAIAPSEVRTVEIGGVNSPGKSEKWSLWKAALWGLGIGAAVQLLHISELTEEFYTWPVGNFVGDVIGRLMGLPLVFVIVAALRNFFVGRKNKVTA